MKKVIIDDEKSAIEYIRHVLTDWTAFCIDHPKLVQALEVLLKIHTGYRKASEVAGKIFEEIEKVRQLHTIGNIDGVTLNVRLYELKKKYTEEINNEQRKAD